MGSEQVKVDIAPIEAIPPGPGINPERPPETPARPQWLPEKFKSPEDLAKAYSELEGKLGKPKDSKEPEAAPVDPVAPKIPPPAPAAADPIASFEAEFAAKGELSQESFAKLEQMGYPRRLVENYIEGARSRAAQDAESIYAVVGGADRFKEMSEWAGANLTPDEVNALNEGLASGGVKAITATRALAQAYQTQNGAEPSLISATGVAGKDGSSYESYAELMKDMGRPEYQTDPAFRKKVEQKLARSNAML